MFVPGIHSRDQHIEIEKESHDSHPFGLTQIIDEGVGDDRRVILSHPENRPAALVDSETILPSFPSGTSQFALEGTSEKRFQGNPPPQGHGFRLRKQLIGEFHGGFHMGKRTGLWVSVKFDAGVSFKSIPRGTRVRLHLWLGDFLPSGAPRHQPDGIRYAMIWTEGKREQKRFGVMKIPEGYDQRFGHLAARDLLNADNGWKPMLMKAGMNEGPMAMLELVPGPRVTEP